MYSHMFGTTPCGVPCRVFALSKPEQAFVVQTSACFGGSAGTQPSTWGEAFLFRQNPISGGVPGPLPTSHFRALRMAAYNRLRARRTLRPYGAVVWSGLATQHATFRRSCGIQSRRQLHLANNRCYGVVYCAFGCSAVLADSRLASQSRVCFSPARSTNSILPLIVSPVILPL